MCFVLSEIHVTLLEDCLVETMLCCTADAQEFSSSFVTELLLESVFLSVDPYMRYIFLIFKLLAKVTSFDLPLKCQKKMYQEQPLLSEPQMSSVVFFIKCM